MYIVLTNIYICNMYIRSRRLLVEDVLYTYGFYLGLAFQIADDVLDFTGGEELGKPVGQDLAEGNLTAPVILCLQGNEDLYRLWGSY